MEWFWNYKRINNFSSQNCYFLCFFVCQFTITWPTIPKIGTHDAFINSYVKSKFQVSRFYRLPVLSKINPHLPKFANQNKGTTRSREVPNNLSKLSKIIKDECPWERSHNNLQYNDETQHFLRVLNGFTLGRNNLN